MAEKRFRVLFMIFSERYFATAPFSRKRSEPSTASTLPASGCGERLVPHFDHLELRGPAFGIKAVALGSHGALLGAPLCGLSLLGIGDVCKGGLCGGFGSACGVPHQQCQLAAVCRDGCALGQQVVQDDAGGDLVAAPDCCAANNNSCNCAANALRGLAACSSRPRLSSPARILRVRSFM